MSKPTESRSQRESGESDEVQGDTITEVAKQKTKKEPSKPGLSKKRKREQLPDQIEIDVNLPEPVSKREARKAKRTKANPNPSTTDTEATNLERHDAEQNDSGKKAGQRSQHGVWIGNLPWSANKDSLRAFLTQNSEITDAQITRVHMPTPTKPPNPQWTSKPLNKGFAYVDFSSDLAMYSAIALTETKMDGRPLLIKNAKSFEGRPEKSRDEEADSSARTGKLRHPPNKRIFVGNLAFDVTKAELLQHFGQCGEVIDVHMATFEDSGKCKGYAWITFGGVEAATSAVAGYIYKEEITQQVSKASKDEGAKGKTQKGRMWLNKLMGRSLRCEYAEDSTVRYNKRYGKEKPTDADGVHPDRVKHFDEQPSRKSRPPKKVWDNSANSKVDARTIKPGAAHTNAQRASQGIVKPEGKKITFD